MKYAIENYNQHGFLKPPKLLWLSWVVLIRGWILFLLAGASREHGSEILLLLSPNTTNLYGLMLVSFPILFLMWLVELRKPESTVINRLVQLGYVTTIVVVGIQLIMATYSIYLHHWQFYWGEAITLLLLFWIAIYLVSNQKAHDCFNPNILLK